MSPNGLGSIVGLVVALVLLALTLAAAIVRPRQ
jgi:hypothetical protein